MKIGSIVAVKPAVPQIGVQILWLPVMDERTPYMIRDFGKCPVSNLDLAYLEEGILGYNSIGQELGFPLQFLIELLPPQVVEIEEVIKQPEYAS